MNILTKTYNDIFIKMCDISTKGSATDTAMDWIKAFFLIFLSLIIFGTLVYLFLSIFKIVREKEDEEEKVKAIKHTVIVIVCLIVEVAITVLIATLMG